MKTPCRTSLALLGLLVLAGCERTGFIIKPVPIREELAETVVATDPGLFVAHKVAVVDVDGLLLNRRGEGLLGWKENPVSLFVEKVDKAQADPNVVALVVRINSPGGGVTASDVMHDRLMKFKAARKAPVVAVIEDVGASGGYYVACAADAILAHPTAITGSIGVIVQTVSFAGTMRMLGIDAKAVVSGQHKDLASPLKPLDEKDLAILQGMVDTFYGRFLEVVAAGRGNLKPDELKALADGRVFTGQQAKASGLVDEVGYVNDAVALAKKRSGARRVKVVMYHRPWGYRANVYAAGPETGTQVNMVNVNVPDLVGLSHPQFLYLWTGQTAGQ